MQCCFLFPPANWCVVPPCQLVHCAPLPTGALCPPCQLVRCTPLPTGALCPPANWCVVPPCQLVRCAPPANWCIVPPCQLCPLLRLPPSSETMVCHLTMSACPPTKAIALPRLYPFCVCCVIVSLGQSFCILRSHPLCLRSLICMNFSRLGQSFCILRSHPLCLRSLI